MSHEGEQGPDSVRVLFANVEVRSFAFFFLSSEGGGLSVFFWG